LIAAFAAYLALHFLLYGVVLRHGRLTAGEKGIFSYHFFPAAAWVIGAAAAALAGGPIGAAHVALIAALHGIYSLTFLELWALADGGYSLAILESVESASSLEAMERLGAAKNEGRLADLERAALVERHADAYRLTGAGKAVAGGIALIVCLADVPMSD
jgi:hypothetical protein